MSVVGEENKVRGGGNVPLSTLDFSGNRNDAQPRLTNHSDMDNNNIKMGSLQELHALIKEKDGKIKDLQKQLKDRDEQIVILKSQLDKYQSVIPQTFKATVGRRKHRAQGISAEPQALSSLQDLASTNFRKHSKSERYVVDLS